MKPKRYPYCGNKKQPHEEIAELKKQIAVNKSMINNLERVIKKQQGIRECHAVVSGWSPRPGV